MLSFVSVIPAKTNLNRGESLNVLAIAFNPGTEVTSVVSAWGKAEDEWVQLTSDEVTLAAQEHTHLYMTIDGYCFTEGFWGEEPEELEIWISDRKPGNEQDGVLVFIRG